MTDDAFTRIAAQPRPLAYRVLMTLAYDEERLAALVSGEGTGDKQRAVTAHFLDLECCREMRDG